MQASSLEAIVPLNLKLEYVKLDENRQFVQSCCWYQNTQMFSEMKEELVSWCFEPMVDINMAHIYMACI